ncbi:MAG TPA: hypothetical protein PLC12_00080 [Candidatus Methanofastidiosa archaeon]|nr:hypothetical protein [Candidatus Methanofastidiosa archaeon]
MSRFAGGFIINKKEILIKIKETEDKAKMDLEKAHKDKDLMIEEAKLKAVAIKEEALKISKERYDNAIEDLYSSKSDEEKEIIKRSEMENKELRERELKNLEKTADIIVDDFVRYVDAMSEEDE